MADSIRKFGETKYRYEDLEFSKAKAQTIAKELRKKGALARVTYEGQRRNGRPVYYIWVNWHHAKYSAK